MFAVGSALHNFAVVDTALMEEIMRAAGAADPGAAAPGFTAGFRIVGTAYVVGNALGVLAWWSRSVLLWWWVIAVNATQALGVVAIPGEMWTVAYDRYGVLGVLPSAVTDGGAAVLTVVLVGTMVGFRTTWARQR